MPFLSRLLLSVTIVSTFSLVHAQTIAIIGTGDLGNSLGPKLADAGYKIIYGSRNPTRDSVTALVALTGNGATATTQKAAARRADIVILAVPWPPMRALAENLGNLENKIVVDATFGVEQADDGYMQSSVLPSGAEYIQSKNPGAFVVKTDFANSYVIDNPAIYGGGHSSFVASDDRAAKEQVARLVDQLGLTPIDAGPLRHAREIEGYVRLFFVPLLQGRPAGWDSKTRSDTFWTCNWQADWYKPVYDADALASFPPAAEPPTPCEDNPPLH